MDMTSTTSVGTASVAQPSEALSPTRVVGDSQGATSPSVLRCHSLVLRTQPTLLRVLLANAKGVGSTDGADGDAGDGDEGIVTEVSVDDEPEVFIELIKFVYMNTCHVDQANVKALMQSAD
eukprot:455634-Amphidinium_carterae.1